MLSYCSKCEKQTYHVCPEKQVMMANIKTREISRGTDKDELEVIVSQFLTDFL